MTILAHKLMRMIETHADALAETLEANHREFGAMRGLTRRVSPEELKTLVGGIYGHLGAMADHQDGGRHRARATR